MRRDKETTGPSRDSAKRSWRWLALLSMGGLLTLVVQQAGAGPRGALLPESRTVVSGGAVTAVKVVRYRPPPAPGTGSATYRLVKGAKVGIGVPAHTRGLILASYNAETDCQNEGTAGSCEVKMVLVTPSGRKIEGQPSGVNIFDETQPGGAYSSETAHRIMERSWGPLAPGNYVVKVLHRVTNAGTMYFGTYGYELTVERVKT